jgi:3-methyladenine DNA glycosylase AlkC
MAEPLKNHFGPDVPRLISRSIAGVWPAFPCKEFIKDSLQGYEALELVPRSRQIAATLQTYLPQDYEEAIDILRQSLQVLEAERNDDHPMSGFVYMPHCVFVAEYGVDHFELSMEANYELTQLFTAEFSIRPYLSTYPDKCLALLKKWCTDPSVDVRRLVSEGTRPRLPWAARLPEFQRDPTPVLALLERLKDDPELYVRRSVANNLNDIGKDHPDRLVATARAWMKGASEDRKWLIRHALRSAVKRGDAGALRILGFGDAKGPAVQGKRIAPKRVHIGDSITVAFEVANTGTKPSRVMVDFRIHYVKANGTSSAKVFKLKALELAPGESLSVHKKISVNDMSTRKHYAGRPAVDAILNGEIMPLGFFSLLDRQEEPED